MGSVDGHHPPYSGDPDDINRRFEELMRRAGLASARASTAENSPRHSRGFLGTSIPFSAPAVVVGGILVILLGNIPAALLVSGWLLFLGLLHRMATDAFDPNASQGHRPEPPS